MTCDDFVTLDHFAKVYFFGKPWARRNPERMTYLPAHPAVFERLMRARALDWFRKHKPPTCPLCAIGEEHVWCEE